MKSREWYHVMKALRQLGVEVERDHEHGVVLSFPMYDDYVYFAKMTASSKVQRHILAKFGIDEKRYLALLPPEDAPNEEPELFLPD